MYRDKTLKCRDCGAEFIFTAGEQQFFEEKGLKSEPQRCKSCRRQRRSSFRQEPGLIYEIVCAECMKTDKINFEPRYDRPVYCKSCYAKKYRK